jgi:hypothetical protein
MLAAAAAPGEANQDLYILQEFYALQDVEPGTAPVKLRLH